MSSPQPTSVIEPAETTEEKPTLPPRLQSSIDASSAPLCDISATLPGRASAGMNEAFSPIEGRITPSEFGPRKRIPPAARLTSSSKRRPSVPISLNPADTMTAALTPAREHSATTRATSAAGTTIIARSISCSTAVMCGYARCPKTFFRLRLIGNTSPWYGLSSRFRTSAAPTLPTRSVAPITAIDWGLKTASSRRLALADGSYVDWSAKARGTKADAETQRTALADTGYVLQDRASERVTRMLRCRSWTHRRLDFQNCPIHYQTYSAFTS